MLRDKFISLHLICTESKANTLAGIYKHTAFGMQKRKEINENAKLFSNRIIMHRYIYVQSMQRYSVHFEERSKFHK